LANFCAPPILDFAIATRHRGLTFVATIAGSSNRPVVQSNDLQDCTQLSNCCPSSKGQATRMQPRRRYPARPPSRILGKCVKIFVVRKIARPLVLALIAGFLPLRGYAGVLYALCEAHHGDVAVAEAHLHDHGEHAREANGGAGGTPGAASICSICAFFSAGASLAPDSGNGLSLQSPVSGRISYFSGHVSVFVPEQPDRPPLPL